MKKGSRTHEKKGRTEIEFFLSFSSSNFFSHSFFYLPERKKSELVKQREKERGKERKEKI